MYIHRATSKRQAVEAEIERTRHTIIRPSAELNEMLQTLGTAPIATGVSLYELLKRPQLDYENMAKFDTARPEMKKSIIFTAQTEIKYEGYVKKQLAEVARQEKMEARPLPKDLDYSTIKGLRIEAQQKLNRVKPLTLGQASRISGVSPADISVLIIYLGL